MTPVKWSQCTLMEMNSIVFVIPQLYGPSCSPFISVATAVTRSERTCT